jgi:cobalt-zinc-cadmium efflux system outer membrane protein
MMKFTLACGLLLVASQARAEPLGTLPPAVDPAEAGDVALPAITLEEALALVRTRSPAVAVELARVDEARAAARSAQVIDNPDLSYMGNLLTGGANTGSANFHQLMLQQRVPLWGQRNARVDVARRELSSAGFGAAANITQLLLDTRRAFTLLLAAQASLTLLRAFDDDLSKVEEVVLGRQRGGVATEYDVARTRVERRALLARIRGAEGDVIRARAELAVLLGQPGRIYAAMGELLPEDLPTDYAQVWETRAEKQPALEAARADTAAAEASVRSARRKVAPTPTVQGGIIRTQNQASTMAYVGLSVPLAIFDHGQGSVGEANARLVRSRLVVEASEVRAKVSVAQALAEVARRRAAVTEYTQHVSGQVQELRRFTEAAYVGSQISILQVLDAMRAERDLRSGELELKLAEKLAEVTLREASGWCD